MENRDGEIHVETDEARGASTPNIVRWILLISLFGAIVLLSIIWITGAATQGEDEQNVSVSRQINEADDSQATDSIVGENADAIDAAEPGETATEVTVENEAADADTPPAEDDAN